MSFSFVTFAQAKTMLAARLNDPNGNTYPDAELGVYLVEALRTWNA